MTADCVMDLDRPIVVIARGGSGTRLISRLLRASGVFLGSEINRQGDSLEWVETIYRLTIETVGKELPRGDHYRRTLRELAREILRRRPPKAQRWGMKLPEIMLVLPLVADAFPHCQVVHLVRHPISIACRRTHLTSRLGNPIGDVVLPAAAAYVDERLDDMDDPFLRNAWSWLYQVERVVNYARTSLNGERYFQLRYEDLCSAPELVGPQLGAFLGVEFSDAAELLAIDPARYTSWMNDDERAHPVWELCGEVGAYLGYDGPGVPS